MVTGGKKIDVLWRGRFHLNPAGPAVLLQHLDPAANVSDPSLPSPGRDGTGSCRDRVGMDQQNLSSPRALNRWTPPESIFSFFKQCWGEKSTSHIDSVLFWVLHYSLNLIPCHAAVNILPYMMIQKLHDSCKYPIKWQAGLLKELQLLISNV